MPDALDALLAEEALPDSYRTVVDQAWRPLADRIADKRRAAGRPILVGINGAQGSGKTTLCRFLAELLLPERGLKTAVLSLDDLYLPHAERQRLAEQVHPLFATRGVPGTHDVALGVDLIHRLLGGEGEVATPRFDKAIDDRAQSDRTITAPVDVLLFEGWCVGAEPQDEAELVEPINALETIEDPDGRWRGAANDALAGPYRALFDPIDLLVMLRPPDFESVIANRRLQEAKLRARTGRGMTDAQLDRFIQHYERLTCHMLATLPAKADVLIDFDSQRQVTQVSYR